MAEPEPAAPRRAAAAKTLRLEEVGRIMARTASDGVNVTGEG